MVYCPAHISRGAVVLCPPIFEERKSAHRHYVEMARTVAADGWLALRFDYIGCGDSDGSYADFSVETWLNNTLQAAAYAHKAANSQTLVLLGLRLGASIAWLASTHLQDACGLVLWQPVTSGKEYLEEELRKKLARDVLLFGKAGTSRRALTQRLENGEEIDFDGYPISPGFYKELNKIALLSAAPPRIRSALVMEIGGRSDVSVQNHRIGEYLASKNCRCQIRQVRCQPFWNLVGECNVSEVITSTKAWLNNEWPGSRHEDETK